MHSGSKDRGERRARLDEQALRAQILVEGRMWTAFDVVESLPSTNVTLAERARSGAAHGEILVAEEQTSGRGRRDRTWSAPPRSSVMLSIVVRPEVAASRWGWIPLLTGVAVVEAVHSYGVDATVKWPNDVLVGDRKVSGVLAEVVPTPSGSAVVVGWAVNVDQDEAELPGDTATSLRVAGGRVDRPGLLIDLLASWERWYCRWQVEADPVRAAYARCSSTLGRTVRAQLPDGSSITGVAVRLDERGGLVVAVDGSERTVTAADVVHLRGSGQRWF